MNDTTAAEIAAFTARNDKIDRQNNIILIVGGVVALLAGVLMLLLLG